jgi:hypothetical protein
VGIPAATNMITMRPLAISTTLKEENKNGQY